MTYLIDRIPDLEKTLEEPKKQRLTKNGLPVIKPHGRGVGCTQWKKYKWELTYYDKKTFKIITGKFVNIADINEKLNLGINTNLIQRLLRYKYDPEGKNGANSFIERWGHIKIVKINEDIVHPHTKSSERPVKII